MCGRYSIATDSLSFQKHFGLEPDNDIGVPNYNATPSSLLPLITNQFRNLLVKGKWGFVSDWGGQASAMGYIINARQETILEKRMFLNLTSTNRCLVPADGFYEWQKSSRTKQPYRFTLKTEELFSFAGLFKTFVNQEGLQTLSFVIITTAANSLVGELHHRMPVILDNERQQQWLTLPWSELQEVFKPYASNQMKCYKVTPRVNSVGYNSKDAIIPWQDPNLTLF